MRGINEKGQLLGEETECRYRGVREHTRNGFVEQVDVTCGTDCLVLCRNPTRADINCSDAQGYLNKDSKYQPWPWRARNINSLN
jgi:hypothetical protein